MEIEQLAAKLNGLANQATLSSAQMEEAKTIMKALKQLGLSNDEISKLTGGRWSVSTVKGYCVGVSPPSHSPWDSSVALLLDVIQAGWNLDDLKAASEVLSYLKSKKVSVDQIAELITSLVSHGIDPAMLLAQISALKEDGLSPEDIPGLVDMIKELEKSGMTPSHLPMLAKLLKMHGNITKAIEAISAFNSLKDIHKEIDSEQKKLEGVKKENAAEDERLKSQQAKLKEGSGFLAHIDKVKKLGFGEKELVDLADLCDTYGGQKVIFKALRSYSGLSEIKKQISAAEKVLSGLQLQILETTARHSHLISAIDMCQALITDQKLGLDAIYTISAVAQKYGPPLDILKAVESYGSFQAIEEKRAQSEGRVTELEERIDNLSGQYQEMQQCLESLATTALKVGSMVTEVETEVAKSKEVSRLLQLINQPESSGFEEHGQQALSVATALRKFVKKHENRFKTSLITVSDLDRLIKDLGGD